MKSSRGQKTMLNPALEVALEGICSFLDARTRELETAAYPALDELTSKLCKTAAEHPEILFLKVNFDENKPMCKNLNVKVLPYFHFYRGADGQLDSFSCSLAK